MARSVLILPLLFPSSLPFFILFLHPTPQPSVHPSARSLVGCAYLADDTYRPNHMHTHPRYHDVVDIESLALPDADIIIM